MPALLDEDPSDLLATLAENFDIVGDTRSLSRITENLSTLRSARTKCIDETRQVLRLLSRKAEIAESSLTASVEASRRRNHADRMLAVDREKFALAKSVNELESNAHGLEGRLAQLREELERIEADDPVERAVIEERDGTLLKLKLYRSFGIDLEEDGVGGYTKAIIRNAKKSDVSIVSIEQKKFGPRFYANFFWNAID